MIYNAMKFSIHLSIIIINFIIIVFTLEKIQNLCLLDFYWMITIPFRNFALFGLKHFCKILLIVQIYDFI